MRIKYIDVLKAFAIVAVVLYHTGLMTYGYLGVDIFLVIAGYLTTKSLYAKMNTPTKPAGEGRIYISFVLSRIIRLIPALLVAGLICLLLGYYVMLPDDYENLSQSVIATNFFGNNILAAITTGNYWDVANDYKPLMHTWYVGVMMQYYLIFPILFYIAGIDKRNTHRTLLTIIGTVGILSLLVFGGTMNDAERFYYLPSRLFEFAVGGVCALVYNPIEQKPFGKGFVYVCYLLLLALIAVNADLMPATVRLVAVVVLSSVLLCSMDVLENKFSGNGILAKIGAASYSIFIWHQIILAFYRYCITNKFTVGSYLILLVGTALMSWLSYSFIEQGATSAIKTKHGKAVVYTVASLLFVAVNALAGIVYMRAGVVRDVPELYISKDSIHRGMHAEYVDRAYSYDKDFVTNKPHWLIVGDSFGRDFVNAILESSIADSVEVSYIYLANYKKKEYINRYGDADRVFISIRGLDETTVSDIEIKCIANSLSPDKVVIVGDKNFGESNGIIYIHRNTPSYFTQRVKIKEDFMERNNHLKIIYGNRFLDLMALITDEKKSVPVFTPDNHYISQDCEHLTKGGAIYFGKLIDWSRFL